MNSVITDLLDLHSSVYYLNQETMTMTIKLAVNHKIILYLERSCRICGPLCLHTFYCMFALHEQLVVIDDAATRSMTAWSFHKFTEIQHYRHFVQYQVKVQWLMVSYPTNHSVNKGIDYSVTSCPEGNHEDLNGATG